MQCHICSMSGIPHKKMPLLKRLENYCIRQSFVKLVSSLAYTKFYQCYITSLGLLFHHGTQVWAHSFFFNM